MLGRAFDAWFLALADPARDAPPPPRGRGALDPAWLCRFADWHGVLPAVARNLRRLGAGDPVTEPLLDLAQGRLRLGAGLSLRIRGQLGTIAAAFAAAGIPAIVLKGPEFADRLYGEPFLRPFTDLDFLLPRDAFADAAAALGALGYRRGREPRGKYPGEYGEESWRLDEEASGTVELHWDLVNSPPLRRRLSVCYGDLAREPAARVSHLQLAHSGHVRIEDATPTPAALLLIAAVHAAASHRFDRLQPLCDVCQAARGAAGAIDAQWLAEAAQRTGSGYALGTALRLAAAAFGEPACEALAEQACGPSDARGLCRGLLTPRTVLHSKTLAAGVRRQLYRELLKRR